MNIETWLSFVAASTILCLAPGPTMFLVIGQSLVHGKKAIAPLVIGVVAGDLIAMTLAIIGLGSLLAASALMLSVLKWAGAIYLVYLGIKSWTAKSILSSDSQTSAANPKLLRDSFLVTVLNPKSIIFFIAFFPSFINTEQSLLPQLSILMSSFLLISIIVVAVYAIFSGFLQAKIKSARSQNIFNKLSGSMLVGAGAFTAIAQR